MKHDWKPGDVAVVANEVAMYVDQNGDRFWISPIGTHWRVDDAPQRPLVVIDPGDREQVERLLSAYHAWKWERERSEASIDDMQTALREFANPTPPKPEEPTGLGAVVEDAEGYQWVRAHGCWYRDNAWAGDADYADIDAVRVLSEGVRP